MNLSTWEVIGCNDECKFGVVQLDGRWLGVAMERLDHPALRAVYASTTLPDLSPYVHFFREVSEGDELGVQDRQFAVLLTGALAQDPAAGWGGIDEWFVPEELRGDPEKFRCEKCETVGCFGGDCEDGFSTDSIFEEEGTGK